MTNARLFLVLTTLVLALLGGCGLHFTSLRTPTTAPSTSSADSSGAGIVLNIFDEDLLGGASASGWPPSCRVKPVESVAHSGEMSLLFDLDPSDWSSGGIGWDGGIDLSSIYPTGCLEFWVKGADGDEVGSLGISDDRAGDGCGVSVKLASFGISREWQRVRIPLTKFGSAGSWWDMAARTERPCDFNWSGVKKIRISTPLEGNRRFKVWVDDMRILATTPGRKQAPAPVADSNTVYTIFWEDFPDNIATSGWPMSCVIMTRDFVGLDSTAGAQVDLAVDDWANAGVRWPVPVDAAPWYETGCLQFAVRGSVGREEANISLGCTAKDGRTVAKGLPLSKYVTISKTWQTVNIPLTEFGPKGAFWDEARKIDVAHEFSWDAVDRMGFSSAPQANTTFRIWLDNVRILKATPVQDVPTVVNSWQDGPRFVQAFSEPLAASDVTAILYNGMAGPNIECAGWGGQTHPRFFRSNVDQTYGLVSYQHILSCYFDRKTGGTISLIDVALDILRLSEADPGLTLRFWARAPEGASFHVGLIDKKMAVSGVLVDLATMGGASSQWREFAVPVARFQVTRQVCGVAFVMKPAADRSRDESPAVLYVDRVVLAGK